MTCLSCGHENNAMSSRCAHCGAPLVSRDSLSDLPLSRASRRDSGGRENPSRRYEEPVSLRREELVSSRRAQPERHDDEPQRRRAGGARLTRKERELFSRGQGGYTSSRRSPAAFRMMLLVLIFILVGVGLAWGASRLFESRGGDAALSDGSPAIELEAGVDKNGNAVHYVTFYGEKGDVIYIRELRKNFTIESDNIRVPVPDSVFISDDPDAEAIEVTLHPVLYPLGKKAKELEPVTYTIAVPPSPIEVLAPVGGREKTYRSIYLIKIKVEAGSTVFIGQDEVTDMIDAENIISHNVNVEPIGDNSIDIRVSTPGYRTSIERIYIERPYMEIPLEISINAPSNSNSRHANITGKTDPNATLTVEPSSESVSVAENGDFTVKVNLKRYGDNVFTIRASMPGKRESVIDHTIYYSPNLDEYSRAAWPMDYAELLKNQKAYQGAIYKCIGTLEEVLSDNPYIFTFNVGKGDEKKLIVVEFPKEKKQRLEIGKKYDIYADLEGTYEDLDLPRFNGRFCLESPAQ